mgnify:FL=1|jgi:hypothetical protein
MFIEKHESYGWADPERNEQSISQTHWEDYSAYKKRLVQGSMQSAYTDSIDFTFDEPSGSEAEIV